MSDFILDPLNAEQKEAVTFQGRHLLVCAGPGTGKTRVITHRIAYLVRHMGIDPEAILAITFTNKAAEEMKQRIERLLGGLPSRPWIGTFHAFSNWLLRRHWAEAKIPKDFLIYDRDDQKSLMKEILNAHELPPGRVSAYLEAVQNLKDDLMDHKSYSIHTGVSDTPGRIAMAKIYTDYQEALRARGALDFGCLLLEAHNLLRDNPEILEKYRKRFGFVFVDEYQDTNRSQYAMAKMLAGPSNSLTCVGDEDQLIYRWRGADPKNILEFDKEFPGAGYVLLNQNYRSTPNIVNASKKLIEKNEMRKSKDLKATRQSGVEIEVIEVGDDREEAGIITRKIQRLMERGVPAEDIAVFYRTNAQSRNFEIDFKMSNIPYRLVGAVGFYARREVKDLLAFVRLLVNPKDETSLWRVLANFPEYSITSDAADKLKTAAQSAGISAWEMLIREARSATVLSKKAQGKAGKLIETHHRVGEKLSSLSLADILQEAAQETGMIAALEAEEDRLLNIWELVESANAFQKNTSSATLSDFLNHTSLLASTSMDNEGGKQAKQEKKGLSLMTVHLAKGLEFQCVFVTGMEEGLFPFKVSNYNQDELEEERRLCYVAMTRAKDLLHVSWANRRMMFGNIQDSKPSRFLAEAGLMQAPEVKEEAPSTGGSVRRGVRVKHPLFGEGKVLSIIGSGKDAKVTVHFMSGSTRKFLASLAPLEVI